MSLPERRHHRWRVIQARIRAIKERWKGTAHRMGEDWIETRPKRHCVDCHFFKFEDASGLGWCDFLNLETRCDVEGCTFHHFKTEQE